MWLGFIFLISTIKPISRQAKFLFLCVSHAQWVKPFLCVHLTIVRATLLPAVCLLFTPFLYWSAVYITDSLCTKNENSSFFKPKIRGLYTRAVTDQERVIMARVRYMQLSFVNESVKKSYNFCSRSLQEYCWSLTTKYASKQKRI